MLARDLVEETSFSVSRKVPDPPERRLQERHLTILRVGTLIVDGRRELCLVRNISAGGLMAHVYCPLEMGQSVAIELKTNHPIEGSVIWLDDANVGIEFASPIDVTELLANPPVLENGWRPRLPRVEVERVATLRVGARTYWVRTRDVSQGGVKIVTDQPIESGSDIVVTLEHFRPIQGVVRWQNGTVCGISFNQHIPFAELIDWLKQAA